MQDILMRFGLLGWNFVAYDLSGGTFEFRDGRSSVST
jgi:hypothetical protein